MNFHFFETIRKNYKYKILFIILVFNLLPFVNLLFSLENIASTIDIIKSLAFTLWGKSNTNSPDILNILHHIFQFNYLVLLIYYLFILISYFVILSDINSKLKAIFLVLINILFIVIFLFKLQYLLPLFLLLNYSILLIIALKNYFTRKTNKLPLIFLSIMTCVGILINKIYNYYSLRNHSLEALFTEPKFTRDIYYMQNISKYMLMDSLTNIYFAMLMIAVVYIILYIGLNIIKRNKPIYIRENIKFLITKVCLILFTLSFISRIVVIGSFSLNLNREITPITGCYKSRMNIGLGENYLSQNKYYLDRCFETTNGLYIVYKETKSPNNNPFDLIKEIEYTRIFILNEQGNEILSINLKDEKINIYATTKEEYAQGYNNLLFVEQYGKDDSTHHFSFYDFSGNFLLELPDGFPEPDYVKQDLLDNNSWRLVFIDNKIIYMKINDTPKNKYIYYIDGTSELIEDEE